MVLRARLWLWVYKGAPPESNFDAVADHVVALPHSLERIEMVAATLSVVGNARGMRGLDRLAAELTSADRKLDSWSSERLRGRLALGWYQILALRGATGAATHAKAYRRARERHDHECALGLGASAGITQAITGHVMTALDISSTQPGDPRGAGWMRMDEPRRAVHAAALCYSGHSDQAAAHLRALEDAGAIEGPEPITMLMLRLGLLVDETSKHRDATQLLEALERTQERPQLLYLALFSLETVDNSMGKNAIEALSDAFPAESGGLIALARHCFRARRHEQIPALLEDGLQLEAGSFVIPALRVVADVARLAQPDHPAFTQARATILRLLARWEGAEPWWLDEVPSPRQREIASRMAEEGASPNELADSLVISRRTVENHLQRVYSYLRIHSRQELASCLSVGTRPND